MPAIPNSQFWTQTDWPFWLCSYWSLNGIQALHLSLFSVEVIIVVDLGGLVRSLVRALVCSHHRNRYLNSISCIAASLLIGLSPDCLVPLRCCCSRTLIQNWKWCSSISDLIWPLCSHWQTWTGLCPLLMLGLLHCLHHISWDHSIVSCQATFGIAS